MFIDIWDEDDFPHEHLRYNFDNYVENDIKPNFNKFDADNSGQIDKSELKNCME